MKRALVIAAVGVLASGAVAGAQTPSAQCPAGAFVAPGVPDQQKATQDVCQKTVDLFDYMAPQLGTAMTGGNTTLGQGGAMGGIGHFAVSVRVNGVFGSLPQVDKVTPSYQGANQDNYSTSNQVLPLPAVDASIGLFKGLPLGLTNVGGVDLLLSASYLPSYSGDNVDVKVQGSSLKIGYGARIGILQESLLVPGISVSLMHRELPTVDITGTTSAGDSLIVRGLGAKSNAWRVTASKNFLVFGLAAGAGQDTYKSEASVEASANTGIAGVGRQHAGPIALSQKLTRTNYFADVYMNVLLAKLVAEVGMVQGGDVSTYNTFDKPADASRTYASVGLRIGF